MLFWILALAITVVSTVAVLRPLLRRTETLRDDPPDVAVYKDQLRALDADVERGVIAEDEAATSRAEIGRRLLAAADRPTDHDALAPARLSAFTALAAAVLVLAGGVGLYINLGTPGLPDQPLASRDFVTNRLSQLDREAEVADQIRAEERTPEGRDAELLAQLRETLEDRPNDPVGHRILARTLTTFGAFVEAREAQTRAIEILGDEATSDDFASLAEIMFFAARGYMSPEAELALTSALQRDAFNPRARYYSGIALAQNGQAQTAMETWAANV